MSWSYRSLQLFATVSFVGITTIAGAFLLSSITYADNDSVVDRVKIKVPVSCTLSGTGMNSHNAEIINGGYQANIGTTILHAFCNDASGFAIYAAGYTGDEIGATNSNKLVGTAASNNATIDTGLATSAGNPDVSNWAMKLAITQDSGNTTGTNAFAIDSDTEGCFSNYHTVPNEYTKVAHKDVATDMTTNTGGVKLTTTYAAYISRTQPADTYSGQVIYTLVHPSTRVAPAANPVTLDTGKTINAKMKSLAATVVNGANTNVQYTATDNYIKTINVHLEMPAPAGFTPTDKNTISSSASKKPIYIVFDNTNDAGIMHYYTEGDQIVLPSDSSHMFYSLRSLTEISGINDWDASGVTNMYDMFSFAGDYATIFTIDISSWDTSKVTNMGGMFSKAGRSATTWSVGNLSSWDTSKVKVMGDMFDEAGRPATTWSIGDLSSWDTSSVTDMSHMFYYAGYSATTWSIGNLSSWDTSKVTNMGYMFNYAGYSATTWSIGNLSSWDTSKVTDMRYMFAYAGYSATTWSIGNLSSWDTSKVTSMESMFSSAGYSATDWSIGSLSSWNTSSVVNMSGMFNYAGRSATTFTLDLSSWNTSKVTDMRYMFAYAGYSATTWSIGNLSSWDTSKVTSMESMFSSAGYSATSFILNLSSWNVSSVMYMSSMFSSAGYSATSFILDLSSWNVSSVMSMNRLFAQAGYSATIWSIGDLSSWDTSSVTNMGYMFNYAGYSATTWSIGNLSSWDTSKVTDMRYMFAYAVHSATTFTLDLSSWDTSSVTNMDQMFYYAGQSATTFTLDLSSWNTSSVVNMSRMFSEAGSYTATIWSIIIPQTNGNNISNTTNNLYGQTTSVSATPRYGKSFTLVQP